MATNTAKNYALVTGATSGIGYELARLLGDAGYNLIVVGRNPNEVEALAVELREKNIDVVPIAKDLFDRENAFSLYSDVKSRNLPVEILVNDAGQGLYGKFQDTDIDRELEIIDLNIASLVILTNCFLQDMLAAGTGKILNLASIASRLPGPWQSVYHGTKAFVLSFSESIREELKDTGITVTALMPGVTDTDFFNKADMNDSKAVQDPDKMADPADVAKDGFDAMMAGKDKVISGLKNKLQVGMANLVSDTVVAHQMNEQQKPVDEE
ncbi:SDR family NAD(P)-dependent oxidoreductase [Dyadobacter sandarakinus]|uniref:SDR family oxidoreductase n=1 Tax=Dyadobacter sandarakinus TaxID=2747268 RepID=A0ABX7I2Z3_9BACT|nr:SDR family oxidoreductase [Dyadobacter sandarakinus]QRR00320.1 SDR family oxidoreductase [Dyadobacter sandarakinus]